MSFQVATQFFEHNKLITDKPGYETMGQKGVIVMYQSLEIKMSLMDCGIVPTRLNDEVGQVYI